MKKAPLILTLVACWLVSCDSSYLERIPQDELTPETYFKTERDLETYVNGLYSYLPEAEDVFSGDSRSDNVVPKSYSEIMAGKHTVPTDLGSGGWSWEFLRRVNYFLSNYRRAEVSEDVAAHYAGVARFFRAWFYFNKVQRFGDVPWYSKPLSPDDSLALYKPRDPRAMVMDSVLADLGYAAAHIREDTPYGTINQWVALALKARVSLHEGTFRKYHGLEGAWRPWLEEAARAANQVMESGAYSLYSTGQPGQDYLDLFVVDEAGRQEFILPRIYDVSLDLDHTANGTFVTTTLGAPGLTKAMVDTYLMADGTRFTARPGHDTLTFYEEAQNRDPRLAQTLRTPGYHRIGETNTLVPNFDNARSGYQIIKFVTSPVYDGYDSNVNDIPIIRYAEVLLINAEAKAELGELTQADLNASINRLRDRVGMPHLRLAGLTVDPVLAERYPNVTGPQAAAILEIRRERRVELAVEGFRYQDLMRWKVGPLLAEPFLGMYFGRIGEHDLDRDGDVDIALVESEPASRENGIQYLILGEVFALSEGDHGNIIVHPDLNKVFETPKHYYFPIPRSELVLNPNLEQSPGW